MIPLFGRKMTAKEKKDNMKGKRYKVWLKKFLYEKLSFLFNHIYMRSPLKRFGAKEQKFNYKLSMVFLRKFENKSSYCEHTNFMQL